MPGDFPTGIPAIGKLKTVGCIQRNGIGYTQIMIPYLVILLQPRCTRATMSPGGPTIRAEFAGRGTVKKDKKRPIALVF